MGNVLVIGERFDVDGRPLETTIEVVGARLRVRDSTGIDAEIPLRALPAVIARYGMPLDDVATIVVGDESLALDAGCEVRMMRHRAAVDVIGRDYIVLLAPDEPPIAAIATQVAAALRSFTTAA